MLIPLSGGIYLKNFIIRVVTLHRNDRSSGLFQEYIDILTHGIISKNQP